MIQNYTAYATKALAIAAIDILNAGTYYLSHGEYERPHYTVRKVRGEACYYIHAKRYFFAGTFYATPSGPVGEF